MTTEERYLDPCKACGYRQLAGFATVPDLLARFPRKGRPGLSTLYAWQAGRYPIPEEMLRILAGLLKVPQKDLVS